MPMRFMIDWRGDGILLLLRERAKLNNSFVLSIRAGYTYNLPAKDMIVASCNFMRKRV